MINCIVAIEKNQGIGFNNSMPWSRLRGDLNFFKTQTTNNIIIMGSKTFKSLNCNPLPNRINIVLSRSKHYSNADHTFSDPDSALVFCSNEYVDKDIFIIGGSEIYKIFMPQVDKFYITEIDQNFECDTFFNLNYVRKNFTNVKEHAKFNDPISYTIKEYNK